MLSLIERKGSSTVSEIDSLISDIINRMTQVREQWLVNNGVTVVNTHEYTMKSDDYKYAELWHENELVSMLTLELEICND